MMRSSSACKTEKSFKVALKVAPGQHQHQMMRRLLQHLSVASVTRLLNSSLLPFRLIKQPSPVVQKQPLEVVFVPPAHCCEFFAPVGLRNKKNLPYREVFFYWRAPMFLLFAKTARLLRFATFSSFVRFRSPAHSRVPLNRRRTHNLLIRSHSQRVLPTGITMSFSVKKC